MLIYYTVRYRMQLFMSPYSKKSPHISAPVRFYQRITLVNDQLVSSIVLHPSERS